VYYYLNILSLTVATGTWSTTHQYPHKNLDTEVKFKIFGQIMHHCKQLTHAQFKTSVQSSWCPRPEETSLQKSLMSMHQFKTLKNVISEIIDVDTQQSSRKRHSISYHQWQEEESIKRYQKQGLQMICINWQILTEIFFCT